MDGTLSSTVAFLCQKNGQKIKSTLLKPYVQHLRKKYRFVTTNEDAFFYFLKFFSFIFCFLLNILPSFYLFFFIEYIYIYWWWV